MTKTFLPARARKVAAALPPGPPPITTASYCGWCMLQESTNAFIGNGQKVFRYQELSCRPEVRFSSSLVFLTLLERSYLRFVKSSWLPLGRQSLIRTSCPRPPRAAEHPPNPALGCRDRIKAGRHQSPVLSPVTSSSLPSTL